MPRENPEPILEIHSGLTLKGQLSMARDVIITGKFEGDLETLGRLTVASGAVMVGSVAAGALILDHGHQLEASVRVTGAPPPKSLASTARAAAGKWPARLRRLKDMAFGRKTP